MKLLCIDPGLSGGIAVLLIEGGRGEVLHACDIPTRPDGSNRQVDVAAVCGLIEKFKAGGAGDIIGSWVGNGENQPISADTLQNVLGSDVVGSLASKVGIDPSQASSILAQVLPHVANGATPNGEVPAGGQVDTSNVLGTLTQLAGMFGGNKQG